MTRNTRSLSLASANHKIYPRIHQRLNRLKFGKIAQSRFKEIHHADNNNKEKGTFQRKLLFAYFTNGPSSFLSQSTKHVL